MSARIPVSVYQRLVKLLSGPSPRSCKAVNVDFTKVGLPEYQGLYASLIHDALSAEECRLMLEAAEASNDQTWDQALVNIGNGKQALYSDVRLCDRIIWDDPSIAEKVLDRVKPHLPEEIVTLRNNARITGNGPVKWKTTYRISRLNERMRFLRYTQGMYFRIHCDGSYATPGNEEITFITVHLYLNGGENPSEVSKSAEDVNKLPLQGGATRFFGKNAKDCWDVNPQTGSILVFQHRSLLHSGEDVIQGTKYTMRSDILYRKVVDDAA